MVDSEEYYMAPIQGKLYFTSGLTTPYQVT